MPKGFQARRGVFSPAGSQTQTPLERLLRHPYVQFAAFSLFIAALVAIVAAGYEVRGASVQESDIGQVAARDIKASRDFQFVEPDVEASARARADAANSVPAVFDWQEGQASQVRERIAEAFSAMRAALAERAREHLEANQPELYERLLQETASRDSTQVWIDPIKSDRLLNWAHEARAENFDHYIEAELSEATFEAFAAEDFSERTQSVLENVVGQVLSNMIVRDMSLLDRQRSQGIYLRRLRGDKLLIVYYITDISEKFVPMARTDTLVQKAADEVLSADRNRNFRRALISTVSALIRPNITYNETKTLEKRDAARHAVQDVVIREDFRKGQTVIKEGTIVSERQYRIIQEMLQEEGLLTRAQIVSGITLFVLLLVSTFFIFGKRYLRDFRPTPRDIIFSATTMVLMLFLTWLGGALLDTLAHQLKWGSPEAWYFLIPVAAAGMLIRLVLNNEHAVIYTIIFSALVALVGQNSLFIFAYTLIGTLAGISAVQQVKQRMALMWSGAWVGAANACLVVALRAAQGELFAVDTLYTLFFAVASGILSGFFVLAVLPLFEAVFGYTTDIKLLELANVNHPLLRELVVRAPGSYHHSMMVGSLSEAAAEAVGANPLLSRVGAYYHDIGKAKNPQYFAENQRLGENPHDKLKPNMSALIIKAHVKDGLEMARQHRLPRELQDFIAQHHGTSLISFFYHRAKQMEDPDIPEVKEKDYRYPGPKPQTRETAICMLADKIEASSRAHPNPTPDRLKGLVQRMINTAFTDGQLDECDLTLKDLNLISAAFNRILNAIHHNRPVYPEQIRSGRANMAGSTSQDGTQPVPRARRAQDATKTGERAKIAETNGSASGAVLDVWEITKEKVESIQQESDAHRSSDSGEHDKLSPDPQTGADDTDEGRSSLPRLGPH